MNQTEILNYWKSLINDKEMIEEWDEFLMDEGVPAGFFYCFRPNGADLDKVFSIVKNGETTLKRLMEIYEATAASFEKDYAYFIVTDPPNVPETTIKELINQYINNLKLFSHYMKDDELCQELQNDFSIEITQGSPPNERDNLDIMIHENISDYLGESEIENDPLFLFEEALYMLACSYDIVHYVLWSNYEIDCDIDLFKPLIELWKLDINIVFKDDYTVVAYKGD